MSPLVVTYADRWRNLRAWGRHLGEAEVSFRPRERASWGLALALQQKCLIAVSRDLPDTLATVLHEYAHLAAPAGTHHGFTWRERYAAAILEVTGVWVSEVLPQKLLDEAARSAIASWLGVS